MKKQTKLGLVLAAAAVISVSVASLVSARGWVQNGADWYYVDNSGEYVTETIQSSGNSKFYLGEDGTMQRDWFLEDYNGNSYYFGQNGAMVTNTWVAIESSRVENQGDYVPDNYWYYFQASGKAMKGSNNNPKKTTIDGKKYAFNEYGQMATGWVKDTGEVINPDEETNPFKDAVYYAGGDNDGVLRAGWVTYYDGYDDDADYAAADYANLYFYFNTSNNKKQAGGTKKINGRTYAFDENGIMLAKWDAYQELTDITKVSYFSDEDDGHQVKKGWVYAVPMAEQDQTKHDDDEEVYMYFNASGEIVRDQEKKINGKYYVFNRAGIMKTGVVMWIPDGFNLGGAGEEYHFVNTLDLDWATGEELSKKGVMRFDDESGDYIQVDPDGVVIEGANRLDAGIANKQIKLRLYGSDGARKTAQNVVEFSDENYTLHTTAQGDKGSGSFSKKYYSLGIVLKASSDIRYGMYNTATYASLTDFGTPLRPQTNGTDDSYYRNNLASDVYTVLNTGGSKQKGSDTAKKDADGNYWLIDRSTGALKGIWTVNVKRTAATNFKTRSVRIADIYAEGCSVASLSYARNNAVDTDYLKNIVLQGDLFEKIMDDNANTDLQRYTWKAVNDTNSNVNVHFEPAHAEATLTFQADINDQTNKWIPSGVFDGSGKTVVYPWLMDASNVANKKYHAYEVKPNDDYFLNCTWK